MSEDKDSKKLSKLGLRATWIYLFTLCVGIPLAAYFGAIKLEPLTLNTLGDFLAGAIGPLAIFWLVLGFFQQGAELRHSVDALKLQAEELKNSVEQQKAMVGITEKQLELDVEVREEQNLLLRSKELPMLQLQASGNSGGGGSSKGRIYTIRVTNIGANAQSIRGKMDYEGVDLRAANRAFTAQGAEYNLQIHTIDSPDFPSGVDHELTIVSTNLRGHERRQVFRVGNFPPEEIVCEPPRG